MKTYYLEITKKAAKKYKKLVSRNIILKKKIQETLVLLTENPFTVKLKTHKVHINDYGLVYSSSITGDIRMIWEFSGDLISIILIDIGGHSEKRSVYK